MGIKKPKWEWTPHWICANDFNDDTETAYILHNIGKSYLGFRIHSMAKLKFSTQQILYLIPPKAIVKKYLLVTASNGNEETQMGVNALLNLR